MPPQHADLFLRKNFRRSELTCSCGCGMLPDDVSLDHLQALRSDVNFAFILTSAARCPTYDAYVHRNRYPDFTALLRDGPHTVGAFDVQTWGAHARLLVGRAIALGWTGIGLSQKGDHGKRFIHLDRLVESPGRPRPWLWTY